MRIDVACFDMDGTLVRGTDSVRFLCQLNNRLEELEGIERQEKNGRVTWVEADHRKAALIRGLNLMEVKERFLREVPFIDNIDRVLRFLRQRHIQAVLVTAGPVQVAQIVGEAFGFEAFYGSRYELIDREFTGRITEHLGSEGKLKSLERFCGENNTEPRYCVAIGDSESDLAIFRACGKSIAINHRESLEGQASAYIRTGDLSDILEILKPWLGE